MPALLTISNPKTLKGLRKGYVTAILHLAPAWQSSKWNTCAAHTAECAAACLYFAGRGRMAKTQAARLARTARFYEDRAAFIEILRKEIDAAFWRAFKSGYEFVVRLNGTSDIRWENENIIQQFPDIQFYDYTKILNRRNLPPNYHLTYSFSGTNLPQCKAALATGMSVAVPFLRMPASWQGYHVIDGDTDDLRFLTDKAVVIGLKAKGLLRRQPTSPFLGDNHA